MTQIRSLSQPQPRRPGELGVHSVDSFNFTVPDLKQAQKFYTDFGLDVREEDNVLSLYTVGHDHRWGRVSEGPSKKFSYVSFGAYPEDFEGLRTRLRQFDVKQLDPPAGFESNGIWFRDPWGSYSEYSSDIDYIPVDCDWPSDDHPGHDAFYVWGPNPPADFVTNFETA